MKKYTNPSDPFGIAVADVNPNRTTVEIDDPDSLVASTNALVRALALPEIGTLLSIVIQVETDHLRVCFEMFDREIGCVVLRSPGDGSCYLVADTLLQELENRSSSEFECQCFDWALAWIRQLALTLANLDKTWSCIHVHDAAKERLRRLSSVK